MKKVLIIENDLNVARLYLGLLRMEHMDALVAHDPKAALESLHSFQPDLVLLDSTGSTLNGFDLLLSIRSQRAYRDLPVIALASSFGSMDQNGADAAATLWLGKDETKPNQLLQAISRIFSNREKTGPAPQENSSDPQGRPRFLGTTRPVPACGRAEHSSPGFISAALLEQAPRTIATVRGHLHALARSTVVAERKEHLGQLCQAINSLIRKGDPGPSERIGQMCDALLALLDELKEKPVKLTASCMRTLAQAADFLETLFAHATGVDRIHRTSGRILVVDDEPISRKAICSALDRAKLQATCLDDAKMALTLLTSNPFDLLFLDVDMPEMNGFELCQAVRAAETNKTTPVVFVTALTDFEHRALSIKSGGNDFITKPFSPRELMVKSLLHLLKIPTRGSDGRMAPTPPARSAGLTAAASLVQMDQI